jgi:hypothetical protein
MPADHDIDCGKVPSDARQPPDLEASEVPSPEICSPEITAANVAKVSGISCVGDASGIARALVTGKERIGHSRPDECARESGEEHAAKTWSAVATERAFERPRLADLRTSSQAGEGLRIV